jgi:predicted MFS family arabinose efflux permease
MFSFSRQVGADIHASQTAFEIIAGFATAGYAWGALLGGDLIQRFRQRELCFLCEFLFAIGCLFAAIAHGATTYAAGRVLSGFATGLLPQTAAPA